MFTTEYIHPVSPDAIRRSAYGLTGAQVTYYRKVIFGIERGGLDEEHKKNLTAINRVVRAMEEVWDKPIKGAIATGTYNSYMHAINQVFDDKLEQAAVYAVLKNYDQFWKDTYFVSHFHLVETLQRFKEAFREPTWEKYIGVTLIATRMPGTLSFYDLSVIAEVEKFWDKYDSDTIEQVAQLMTEVGTSVDGALAILEYGIDDEMARAVVG